MNTVAIVPGVLIASFLGLLFYFIVSENLKRMILYIITSNIFFFIGQFVSQNSGLQFLRLGSLNLISSLTASAAGLLLIRYLAGPPKLHKRGQSR